VGGLAFDAAAKARRAKAAEAAAPPLGRQSSAPAANLGRRDAAAAERDAASAASGSSTGSRLGAGSNSPPSMWDGPLRRRSSSSGVPLAPESLERPSTALVAAQPSSLLSGLFAPVGRRHSESFRSAGNGATPPPPQEHPAAESAAESAAAVSLLRLHGLALSELRRGTISLDEFDAMVGSHAAFLGVAAHAPSDAPAASTEAGLPVADSSFRSRGGGSGGSGAVTAADAVAAPMEPAVEDREVEMVANEDKTPLV
jgi:hypothetical protein